MIPFRYQLIDGSLTSSTNKSDDSKRPACWYGTTSDLLDKLTKTAIEHNINISSKSWPKAANSLSRKLKIILSNIREGLGFGLSVTRNTTGKYKGMSAVKVWKIPSPSSPSSPDQNQAQNQGQNSEDTSSREDMYSHQEAESSPESEENPAQKLACEDSEDSEDNVRTFTDASTNVSTVTIYRLGRSDIFACHNCRQNGDKWFMNQHKCNGRSKSRDKGERF